MMRLGRRWLRPVHKRDSRRPAWRRPSVLALVVVVGLASLIVTTQGADAFRRPPDSVATSGASGTSTANRPWWKVGRARRSVATPPTTSTAPPTTADTTTAPAPPDTSGSSPETTAITGDPATTADTTTSTAVGSTTTSVVQTTTTRSATTAPPPTTVATTSPAPAPGAGATGCAASPSSCGYPDASNTGVSSGAVLRKVPGEVTKGNGWVWDSRGWLEINTPGAVVENVEVPGGINVEASNVTIRNVRIIQAGDGFGIAIRHAQNVVIQDSEIAGPDGGQNRLMVAIKDIYSDASGVQVLRNDIWNVSTGIQIYGGLIQDNYIHDMGYRSGDHINGTTDNGGSGEQLILRHNTIFNQHDQTDAISLFQDFGRQANRIIDANLVAGGGYTIYGGANAGAPVPTGIKITNNRFARIYFPNGGYWGPVAAYNGSGAGNAFTGNVWDDTGKSVNA